jgi:phage tail sheath protein FI
VWWLSHVGTTTNWGSATLGLTFGSKSLPYTKSLVGGNDDNENISVGEIETGWDLFKDPDSSDVSLLISGPATPATLGTYIIDNIAAVRKDAVAFVSPLKASVVDNVGSEKSACSTDRDNLPSSSYAFMDSGWKYLYDKYNDVYRWVPLNGDIAGLSARTDQTNDPWYSPAGFTRGNIKNVVKLAWTPTQGDRDDLYKLGINPVVSFPGQGVLLYGDKTLLNRPSAFDRINVRRLFIVLEKAISRYAKSNLFEFNDEFTRSSFKNVVEPYLRDIQARRGITDFLVVCDATNNTSEVIDRNEFAGDIYVKPARSINYIQLNFVAVRTGVSFQEVVGAV